MAIEAVGQWKGQDKYRCRGCGKEGVGPRGLMRVQRCEASHAEPSRISPILDKDGNPQIIPGKSLEELQAAGRGKTPEGTVAERMGLTNVDRARLIDRLTPADEQTKPALTLTDAAPAAPAAAPVAAAPSTVVDTPTTGGRAAGSRVATQEAGADKAK